MTRRIRAIALALGLVLAVALPVAGQQADDFVGNARATGFELTIADNGLVIGYSEAGVQTAASDAGCGADSDTVRACAFAAGELNFGETAEASAPGDEGPNTATAFALPEELEPLLALQIGDATAQAAANGTTTGQGDAAAALLAVNATRTLFENAEPLQEGLLEISDTLLGPIAEGDPSGTAQRVKDSFDLLVENLDDMPLATLEVGPTRSVATDEDGVTSVTATADGARLIIAPFPDTIAIPNQPPGLIIVEVGRAEVRLTSDRTDATAEADPALVRVRILDPTTGEYDDIPVGPGPEAVTVLEDTPLETTIFPAGTITEVEGAGASARAAAVRIETLADPLPEVVLSLAYAEGGVASAAPAPPPPAPAPEPAPQDPQPAPDLPRTGAALVPALGLLLVGGAGLYGARRRR